MSSDQKVPSGRIARLARIVAVGGRASAGALGDGDGDAAAARAFAETLGTLRGLAMKLGQIASYVDGIVPERHRAVVTEAFAKLRSQAPRSRFDEVRQVIEQELRAPLDSLFVELDPEPFASASIAQVHRARLANGDEVAVKVQHPGTAEAMESDLANAGLLESLASLIGGRKLDSKRLLAVLKERIREELDFEHEARNMLRFAQIHEGDAQVHVPRVIADRSARRVLTTELVRGATWEEACTEDEPRRRAYVETLWRAVYRAFLVHGEFNTDPHPGNFVFQGDGRVVMLDFGCVQQLSPRRLGATRRLHVAALARDEGAFPVRVRALLDAKPGRFEDAAVAYMRQVLEPQFASPFRVTRSHCAELVGRMHALAGIARTAPEAESFAMPAELLLVNRLQFGFCSLIARFDVSADYAAIERVLLAGIPARRG